MDKKQSSYLYLFQIHRTLFLLFLLKRKIKSDVIFFVLLAVMVISNILTPSNNIIAVIVLLK